MINSRAFAILTEMGPNARSAVPEIIRLAESRVVETRLRTIELLGTIGPASESLLPELVAILRTGSAQERELTARSLGAIGPSAGTAVPDLVSAMKSNRIPLGIAVPALISVGHAPVEAVPLLIAQLRMNTNSFGRVDFGELLGLIGPAAAPAVPVLIDALQDPESRTRARLAFALGQIGPNASSAVPALTTALDDEWWYVRENAAIALGKLKSNAVTAIPVLARLAQGDRNKDVRNAALEAIKSIRPNAVESPANEH